MRVKRFKRKYSCRSDDVDFLTIKSHGGGETMLRFSCEFGAPNQDRGNSEVFVNLNSDQVGDIIRLLQEWQETLPAIAVAVPLWEDV